MLRALYILTIVLFTASLLLQNAVFFVFAVLLGLVMLTTALWGRYALAGVAYTRKLGAPRMFVGEENDLWVEVVNAKPLPLAWLKANDEVPAEIELAHGTLHFTHKQTRRMLTNFFSPRFYERVRKHYRLRAKQRGVLDFGPVELSSGDMFGLRTQRAEFQHTDRLIVYPRVVAALRLAPGPVQTLTQAYLRARYSRDLVSSSDVNAARQAWQTLAQADGAKA